ncbi:MAG: hypothetical protein ABI638_11250 [Ignavibacteriota bacterium]
MRSKSLKLFILTENDFNKNTYVDYSHGIRLLNEEIIIDDKLFNIKSILKDPVLYKLLSDENAPMTVTEY